MAIFRKVFFILFLFCMAGIVIYFHFTSVFAMYPSDFHEIPRITNVPHIQNIRNSRIPTAVKACLLVIFSETKKSLLSSLTNWYTNIL